MSTEKAPETAGRQRADLVTVTVEKPFTYRRKPRAAGTKVTMPQADAKPYLESGAAKVAK